MNSLVSYESIEIAGPFGPMRVKGYRYRELAVHHTLAERQYWAISHLPSGLSFGFRWLLVDRAISAMIELYALRASWKCTPQDVEATPGIYELLTKHRGRRYKLSQRGNAQKGMNGYPGL